MDTVISTTKFTSDEKGQIFQMSCLNRLEALLTNIRPAAYSAWGAGSIIMNLVDWANTFNINTLNWIPIQTGSIQTSLPSGSPMQNINYYQNYKPLYQQIEDLSAPEFTGYGTYFGYLNSDNYFIWGPRNLVSSGSIHESETTGVTIEYGAWDVINAAIINGGVDLNKSPIFGVVYNAPSIGKVGFKWKYLVKQTWAEEIKLQNPSASNADIRTLTQTRIREYGTAIINVLAAPRYKADFEMLGTNKYVAGGLWSLTVPSYGWVGKKLRLIEISHKYNSNGWMTTLHFEEDDNTALVNL
jgi:hypothetical protein